MTKQHQYPHQLVEQAKALTNSEDFKLFMAHYVGNLQMDIMDSEEDNITLELHNEYKAIRNFVEYLNLVGESTDG